MRSEDVEADFFAAFVAYLYRPHYIAPRELKRLEACNLHVQIYVFADRIFMYASKNLALAKVSKRLIAWIPPRILRLPSFLTSAITDRRLESDGVLKLVDAIFSCAKDR